MKGITFSSSSIRAHVGDVVADHLRRPADAVPRDPRACQTGSAEAQFVDDTAVNRRSPVERLAETGRIAVVAAGPGYCRPATRPR